MCISFRHNVVLLIALMLLSACGEKDASLREVDSLIEKHQAVQAQYQARLDSLRSFYQSLPMTDEERFECCGRFFDMYRGFNLDSQLVYVQQRMELAYLIANPEYMHLAQMNRAEVLMRSGMYHEALHILDDVSILQVEPGLLPYYYHLRRTLYGLMEDSAITESEQRQYHRLTQAYRDSILCVEPEESFVHEVVRSDALYADGLYTEALQVLEGYESSGNVKEDQQCILSITKAQIYRALGNHEEEKHYLIISACSDLKDARREYIALRDLAMLLYKEGDIERAHVYIHCCIEDAKAGGMRGRSLEISTVYPIIESAYQRQETIRERMLYGLIGSITLLAGMLGLFLIYTARKRKQLALLNELLQKSNLQLQQSNRIRTVYVAHYMEMASALIERFDNWRKILNTHAKAEDFKHLQAEIASQHFTQEQLNIFYRDFDEAFLAIFPNFVEEVKSLLVDGTEFSIKPDERLNTDLRVLCCIRLGITDSKQIASFLRYSLSTIYNSRTRMRNLAKENRDEFEQKVATF